MTITPIVQGAILSLLSAMLGFWAGFLKQHREDAKKRAAVASALLTELRWLERMLRKMARHDQASSTVRITPGVYDRFEGELVLFDSDVTAPILHFRAFIRDIETSRENVVSGRAGANEEAHHYFRVKAAARQI